MGPWWRHTERPNHHSVFQKLVIAEDGHATALYNTGPSHTELAAIECWVIYLGWFRIHGDARNRPTSSTLLLCIFSQIILTVRNSEEEWVRSLEKQVQVNNNSFLWRFMQLLSPTCRRSMKFIRTLGTFYAVCLSYLEGPINVLYLSGQISFGGQLPSTLTIDCSFNKEMSKRLYRQHNAYVMQVRMEIFEI